MSDTVAAIILGIVEGLTEFLPVSSTGHLILASDLLGYDAEKWKLFNIVIQPGAILAIVVLYWRTFVGVLMGLLRREAAAIAFLRNILIAFTPAVLLGLAFHKQIEALLGNAVVVAWALIVGGIAILVIERLAKVPATPLPAGVSGLSLRQAALVGAAQCLAMVPGVSRSGATIMGALSLGIDRKTAAEFSFFLALPTLVGATVLELVKNHDALKSQDFGLIGIGFVVSFIVALVVVKGFVSLISRIGFAPFGWYRIVAGAAALVWLGMK